MVHASLPPGPRGSHPPPRTRGRRDDGEVRREDPERGQSDPQKTGARVNPFSGLQGGRHREPAVIMVYVVWKTSRIRPGTEVPSRDSPSGTKHPCRRDLHRYSGPKMDTWSLDPVSGTVVPFRLRHSVPGDCHERGASSVPSRGQPFRNHRTTRRDVGRRSQVWPGYLCTGVLRLHVRVSDPLRLRDPRLVRPPVYHPRTSRRRPVLQDMTTYTTPGPVGTLTCVRPDNRTGGSGTPSGYGRQGRRGTVRPTKRGVKGLSLSRKGSSVEVPSSFLPSDKEGRSIYLLHSGLPLSHSKGCLSQTTVVSSCPEPHTSGLTPGSRRGRSDSLKLPRRRGEI